MIRDACQSVGSQASQPWGHPIDVSFSSAEDGGGKSTIQTPSNPIPDGGMAARLFTSTTLHAFLDEMEIDATEEYLKSQLSQKDQL